MLALDAYEILSRLSKRYKGWRYGVLLRFEDERFEKEVSILDPKGYLKLVQAITAQGFRDLGGWTDRGLYKLVKASERVAEWLKGVRERVGFRNLYAVFFYKPEPPSGLLVLAPSGFVFIPGVTHPKDTIWMDYTSQPESRKKRLKEMAERHGLIWWGSVTQPVVIRACRLDEEQALTFITDTISFFEETGYAEI